jgi:deferrochelatase/peroxidase EfeB
MKPFDRRTFLVRGGALLGAAGAGSLADSAGAADGAAAAAAQPGAASGSDLATREPFTGTHQAGILNPPPAQATLVALDSLAPDQRTLQHALQALSNRARELTTGGAVPLLEVDAPPVDSGILGPDNAPDALTVTVGFGASLFDHARVH